MQCYAIFCERVNTAWYDMTWVEVIGHGIKQKKIRNFFQIQDSKKKYLEYNGRTQNAKNKLIGI